MLNGYIDLQCLDCGRHAGLPVYLVKLWQKYRCPECAKKLAIKRMKLEKLVSKQKIAVRLNPYT
ncbi:MAG: hypothetical protein HY762_00025, partial [Planctomycetes bacterium]|nr:hypothetical protein [Planctomycetota bacterium]